MFSRANLPGWALFEVLTSAQMNILDVDHANSLDGAGGGNYDPAVAIDVGGAGLVVSGPFQSTSVASFDGVTGFSGAALFTGGLAVNSLATFSGTTQFDGAVTINGNLTATANAAFDDGLSANGPGIVTTVLAVSSVATIVGSLHCIAAVDFDGALNVDGLTSLDSLICGPAIMGVTLQTDKFQLSGAGRIQKRVVAMTNSDMVVGVNTCDLLYQPPGLNFSAVRRIDLSPTGAEDGMQIEISRMGGSDVGGFITQIFDQASGIQCGGNLRATSGGFQQSSILTWRNGRWWETHATTI